MGALAAHFRSTMSTTNADRTRGERQPAGGSKPRHGVAEDPTDAGERGTRFLLHRCWSGLTDILRCIGIESKRGVQAAAKKGRMKNVEETETGKGKQADRSGGHDETDEEVDELIDDTEEVQTKPSPRIKNRLTVTEMNEELNEWGKVMREMEASMEDLANGIRIDANRNEDLIRWTCKAVLGFLQGGDNLAETLEEVNAALAAMERDREEYEEEAGGEDMSPDTKGKGRQVD